MADSQNGWSVLEDRPPYLVVPYIEPKVPLAVRSGDVAVVLLEVARRWHDEVEPLDLPGEKDEWGWAFRPIRGQTNGYSNHASGTAIDLNATRHPRGVPTADTMSPAQIARCRAIRASMHDDGHGGPVVRWGGDYRPPSKPDAMHWEIADNVSRLALRRVADRIRGKWEELEENNMDDATVDRIAKRTVALLLSADLETYHDKDQDGKRDHETVAQALAGSHSEAYFGRTLEQKDDPTLAAILAKQAKIEEQLATLLSRGPN